MNLIRKNKDWVFYRDFLQDIRLWKRWRIVKILSLMMPLHPHFYINNSRFENLSYLLFGYYIYTRETSMFFFVLFCYRGHTTHKFYVLIWFYMFRELFKAIGNYLCLVYANMKVKGEVVVWSRHLSLIDCSYRDEIVSWKSQKK